MQVNVTNLVVIDRVKALRIIYRTEKAFSTDLSVGVSYNNIDVMFWISKVIKLHRTHWTEGSTLGSSYVHIHEPLKV